MIEQDSKKVTARTTAVVVLVTVPSASVARRIARETVKEKLAACCNILPGITSFYTWKGKMEKADEALLIIKTRRECVGPLASVIRRLHPYTVPEIIALPIVIGGGDYLAWINESTRSR